MPSPSHACGVGPSLSRGAGEGVERHPISSNRRFPAASLIGENASLFGGNFSLFDRVGKCHRERRIPRRSQRSERLSGADSRDFPDFLPAHGNSPATYWLDEPSWISL